MINARDAKKQSEQNAIIRLQESISRQRNEIKNYILEAIEKGDTFINYPGNIYDEIVTELAEAGYEIIRTYHENIRYSKTVTISWEYVD